MPYSHSKGNQFAFTVSSNLVNLQLLSGLAIDLPIVSPGQEGGGLHSIFGRALHVLTLANFNVFRDDTLDTRPMPQE